MVNVDHSEFYPWTITIRGDMRCQPFHALTGERGPEFPAGDGPGQFKLAHSNAEQWVADRIAGDAREHAAKHLRELASKLATFSRSFVAGSVAADLNAAAGLLDRPSAGPYVDGMRELAENAGEPADTLPHVSGVVNLDANGFVV